MKNRTLPLRVASFAAVLVLAACHKETEVVGQPDDMKEQLANAAPVQLPPSIKSNKTYRCKDNSVIYVTFMTDDLTAAVRDKESDPPIATLTAPEKGKAFVTPGYSLSGSSDTVNYLSPKAGEQSCHV